jgi:chromate reductase, NAD(P)H dehydrogenase (quinone)
MKEKYHFVAISGSVRSGSYNTLVLKALQKIAPKNVVIEQLLISEVPIYNFDLHEHQIPLEVKNLNDAIEAADAVIIISPEYNFSVPGALKNAIDFISRSPKRPFAGKPTGIMGASNGNVGTARMQYHLRQVLVGLNAFVMNKPEIMIAQVITKFDEAGNLKDEKTKEFLLKYIESLVEFSNIFNRK